ncbi:Fe-Mn family superoxide dismutase [Exophiala viscosa]|uniref:Fe-Mn family superoxide dismutase n=1 Tax=Exophiala viscosa TaxID=2486360 RepID=UPI00219D75B5|nr:Fe-Mn family superoxide dismutase [Exophiala viscosa]
MAVEQYSLPGLRYSLDALEPSISGQIMDLHYNKHHQTYITNLNKAPKETAEALSNGNLVKQLELQSAIKFNAGGHVNHTLFWENLSPSFENFQTTLETTALAIQGSGWVWLVKNELGGRLEITTSKDQDLPVPGNLAVLGIDMWEHAYYLQYWNNKKECLNNIWAVLNWNAAGKRYLGDRRAIYGDLAGLASRL